MVVPRVGDQLQFVSQFPVQRLGQLGRYALKLAQLLFGPACMLILPGGGIPFLDLSLLGQSFEHVDLRQNRIEALAPQCLTQFLVRGPDEVVAQ